MSRTEVEPTREAKQTTSGTEYKFSHPAFGQVQVGRTMGGSSTLYGSEFEHQHQIRLTITLSEEHRSLNRSWYFPRQELIEISMSEHQWASMVSSFNLGSGTPVTIRHIKGEMLPGIKSIKKTDMFREELSQDFKELIASIDAMAAEFEDDSKKMPAAVRDRMKALLNKARNELTSSMPWVFKQFEEHMEDTVEAAKSEVHAYAQSTLQGLGIERLNQMRDAEQELSDQKTENPKKLVLRKKPPTE